MSKQFLRFQVCEEAESVFSENINTHIANQCVGMKVVIDPFCGAGENIIQLAKVCDLSTEKIYYYNIFFLLL
jgi:hypothetical protein